MDTDGVCKDKKGLPERRGSRQGLRKPGLASDLPLTEDDFELPLIFFF